MRGSMHRLEVYRLSPISVGLGSKGLKHSYTGYNGPLANPRKAVTQKNTRESEFTSRL